MGIYQRYEWHSAILDATWSLHSAILDATWSLHSAILDAIWSLFEPLAGAASWVNQTAANINKWTSVTYGTGLFVAVGSWNNGGPSTNRVMTSPDGIIWTGRACTTSLTSVTFGNGLFVGVSSSSAVMISADGITWTSQTDTAGSAISLWAITYGTVQGNPRYVAVGSKSPGGSDTLTLVVTSSDGASWTATAATNMVNWVAVAYGNGRFVAVANGVDSTASPPSYSQFMTSTDGINWSAGLNGNSTELPNPTQWTSVVYGYGTFVAVGGFTTLSDRPAVITSTDGITWTSRSIPESCNWKSVTFGGTPGLFVAVGNIGNEDNGVCTHEVITSPDGITWTGVSSSVESSLWTSVTYGGGTYVAVAKSVNNNTPPPQVMTYTP